MLANVKKFILETLAVPFNLLEAFLGGALGYLFSNFLNGDQDTFTDEALYTMAGVGTAWTTKFAYVMGQKVRGLPQDVNQAVVHGPTAVLPSQLVDLHVEEQQTSTRGRSPARKKHQ